MMFPAKPLRRRIGVLAFHLGLLALPVLTGWQAPAHASGDQTAIAIDRVSFAFDTAAQFSHSCSPRLPMTGKIAVRPGMG